MLAIYPGNGARYMRHIDNPDGNGRLLTVLYYLNSKWCRTDGGELHVWRPDDDDGTGREEEEASTTIAPLLDRVVLFWSDERCPHEVLPAHAVRLAISVWFHTPCADDGATDKSASAIPRAMRAVAAAAASAGETDSAWQRAKVLSDASRPDEQARQRVTEAAHATAMRTAARALREKAHVALRVGGDRTFTAALAELPRTTSLHGLPSGGILWVDSAVLSGKLTILLHQVLPSRGFAAGCTRPFLARSCNGDVRWLTKPIGAKALAITTLVHRNTTATATVSDDDDEKHEDNDDDDDDGCASVHSRRRALTANRPPPGWPRESGSFVLLEKAAGALHVFDCATQPLAVRLCDIDVCGMWTFGGGDGVEALLRRAEATVGAEVDP